MIHFTANVLAGLVCLQSLLLGFTPASSQPKDANIEVIFFGNRVFSSQVLLEQMKLRHDPGYGACTFTEKEGCSNLLADDLERVRFFLGTRGHIEARIAEPVVERSAETTRILIQVQEGPRYRIGTLAVKGARAMTENQILEISTLKSGEIINAEVIQSNLYSDLNHAYLDRGYLQSSVDFVPKFKLPFPTAPEGIVDVVIEIDEGRLFRIHQIEVVGTFSDFVKSRRQVLRDAMLIWDGDVYSRKLILESINNLNRLGWFEEIREKNLIIRTSPNESTIDIDLSLVEKKDARK